jgi:CO/xanthine dehydrogenase Mo-binding subunit
VDLRDVRALDQRRGAGLALEAGATLGGLGERGAIRFTATGMSSVRWRATQIDPIPPRVSGRSIWYLPATTAPSRIEPIA